MSKQSKIEKLERQLAKMQEFCELWALYFQFFADEQDAIDDSQNYDNSFRQVQQQIAMKLVPLSQMLEGEFTEGSGIMKILDDHYSLKHLKEMPDTEFDRMQVTWHEIFLKLHKIRGKLEHKLPPKDLGEIKAAQQQAMEQSQSIPTQ